MRLAEPLSILNIVESNPSIDVIKKAYRKEQMKWHPDRQYKKDNLSLATQRSVKINAAFEVFEIGQ